MCLPFVLNSQDLSTLHSLASCVRPFGMTDYMGRLNECLSRFKAESVHDITAKFAYHPDYAGARLGSGSYGDAYRMRELDAQGNPTGPIRVVKQIPKARVTKNSLQIQHLCAELAVTGLMEHKYLNRRTNLLHSHTHVFLVLELCEAPVPDVQTRLAHLFATYHPARIGEIPKLVAQYEAERAALPDDAAPPGVKDSPTTYFEKGGPLRTVLAEIGARKEAASSSDLFNLIVNMKRLPDGLSKIITKQALLALEHLHANSVVHRDVKTENLVVAIARTSTLLYDDAGTTVVGVRITETVDCRLIDFGLVKYMNVTAFPSVISPGTFGGVTGGVSAPPSTVPGAAPVDMSNPAQKKAMGFDDDDDDDDSGMPPMPGAAPAAGGAPPKTAFPVQVTPCGTELYCSLEAIDGIISSGVGRTKWTSTSATLPKLDVYGVGTMLFCMANGRPPFRPPKDQYRQVTREERMRQVQRLVAGGPIFNAGVAEETKAYISLLMNNEDSQRPDTGAALANKYITSVANTNSYSYEIRTDGRVRVVEAVEPTKQVSSVDPPMPTAKTAEGGEAVATVTGKDTNGSTVGDDDDAADLDGDVVDDVMAVLRGKEDGGDAAGKERPAPAEKA